MSRKLIVLVPEERLRAVPGRAPVELRLGPDLLAVRCLALVPFPPPEAGAPPADAAGPEAP